MNDRVTPEGQVLGRLSVWMEKRGRVRLAPFDLDQFPRTRGEMCASCACRPGTVPNGCMQTQLDLLKAVVEGVPFLCHAPKDGRMCAGYLSVRAEHVARPIPKEIEAVVREWDFSPAEPTP